MAYEILNQLVNSPGWDATPDIIKRREFETVFKKSRDQAQKELLVEIIKTEGPKAIEKVGKELKK
jgi:hypothetical protein